MVDAPRLRAHPATLLIQGTVDAHHHRDRARRIPHLQVGDRPAQQPARLRIPQRVQALPVRGPGIRIHIPVMHHARMHAPVQRLVREPAGGLRLAVAARTLVAGPHGQHVHLADEILDPRVHELVGLWESIITM